MLLAATPKQLLNRDLNRAVSSLSHVLGTSRSVVDDVAQLTGALTEASAKMATGAHEQILAIARVYHTLQISCHFKQPMSSLAFG
mgnify:CR=1 FL=1